MLLEHQFVTTLDPDSVFRAFDATMRSIGFKQDLVSSPSDRQYSSWRSKATRAKKPDDLPMRAALNFDRGRINLAVSVEDAPRYRRRKPQIQEMLFAVCEAVEKPIVGLEPPDVALARWKMFTASTATEDRKRRKRNVGITLGLIGLLIGGVTECIRRVGSTG